MSSRVVTAIAFKVLAVWLLVHVVLGFPQVAHVALSFHHELGLGNHAGMLYVSLLFAAGLVGGTACYLIFRLSKSILYSVDDGSVDAAGMLSQGLVLQIVGLFFIVSVTVDFPGALYDFYTNRQFKDQNGLPLGLPSLLQLLALFFQFIVGCALLVGSEKSRKILLKLRGRD